MITELIANYLRLLVAPNPGPMTLDGTNTWIVGYRAWLRRPSSTRARSMSITSSGDSRLTLAAASWR